MNEHATPVATDDEVFRLRQRVAELEAAVGEDTGTGEALRESEERYRTVFENTPCPIWVIDEAGRYVAANRPAVEYSRCSREELLRRDVRAFLPPDISPEVLASHHTAWKTGGVLETPFCVPGETKHLKLTITPVRWQGRPVIFGVGKDITAQKRVEAACRESEERFRAEYMALPMPVYTWRRTGDDFTLIDCNDAAMAFTEGKIVDHLGATVGRFFHDAPEIREDFARCFAERSVVRKEMPYRLRTTGADTFLQITYAFVPPDLIMVHTVNITERVRAAEKIKQEQRLLRRLLSIHERERQLIAYEIHDGFVQQATGAKMLLEGFRHGFAEGADDAWTRFEAALGAIDHSIAEARRLISGLRPPILHEEGLGAAVEYLVHEMSRQYGLAVELHNRLGNRRLAPARENALFRVVQEGLTNVVRHSHSLLVRVRLGLHRGCARVEVRDWGTGFAVKDIPGQRFGLRGLRERARLFGGRAAIQSAPGKGTRVRVELPLTEETELPPR